MCEILLDWFTIGVVIKTTEEEEEIEDLSFFVL